MRSNGPLTLQLVGISGLAALVLLTSLSFAWPTLVIAGPEPVQAQLEAPAAQQATCVSQSERERISSSFVQAPVLWFAPDFTFTHTFSPDAPQVWLGEAFARDEFLQAVAARGPPQV
jgi:hypothetical protein